MVMSMTAFARSKSSGDWGSAVWEVRSVNHRYLDLFYRLPEGFREVEMTLREIAQKTLSRGKVECQLQFSPGTKTVPQHNINETAMAQFLGAQKAVEAHLDVVTPPTISEVLKWPGILSVQEADLSEAHEAVVAGFQEALNSLKQHREREGTALTGFLKEQVQSIQEKLPIVKAAIPDIVQEERNKWLERFKSLELEHDSSRLEQEMLVYCQKIDINEEIERLETHIKEVEQVLGGTGPIGRRLDFLMQEMNREANTIASKSSATKTTHAAVDIKVLVEQMREQIQNIE